MVSKLIFSILTLMKLGQLLHADSILSYENVTEYELINFNLDNFHSSDILEFDYNNIHYKVKLFKNQHISPIINHQTERDILIIHDRKLADDIWYDCIIYYVFTCKFLFINLFFIFIQIVIIMVQY